MLNCLSFSIQFLAVPGCTSPGSLILGWVSLPSLLILPPFLTLPHILVPFSALIQFLTCTGTEKNSLDFLFSSPSSTEWHMIGFSFSRFILEVLTLMVIFRALKDKRRVLVLRKGYNI